MKNKVENKIYFITLLNNIYTYIDMDQILDIIKTNVPVLIMTMNNGKQNSMTETILPIMIIPLFLVLFKKIMDNYSHLFELIKNFFKKENNNNLVIIRYYEKNLGRLYKDYEEENLFYNHVMEYLTVKFYNQLTELIVERTKILSGKYILGRRWSEEMPIKQIPLDKHFSIKIDGITYEISHNSSTIIKIDSDSKEGKTIEYNNNYFEIKALSHEFIKYFENQINEYFANQKPLIENFHLHKYNYHYSDETRDNRVKSRTEIKITTKKNWKNVFLSCNEEEIIKNEIMNFINSEANYDTDGIPWKKGYIFYGEPGCGKTSLIYAIGWMTKRDIYSIDLSSIKTNEEFNNIIMDIPEKSIILFDDIDAHEISHCRRLLVERKQREKNNKDKYNEMIRSYYTGKTFPSTDLIIDSNFIKSQKSDEQDNSNTINKVNSSNIVGLNDTFKDEFTLDILLSFLDGYSSLHGCIVIMTTNCIDILDQALVRPGRIDHKVEFKKCNRYQFENIFNFFTCSELPLNYVFKENEYTTSYIINTIIIPNRKNPEKILQMLQ